MSLVGYMFLSWPMQAIFQVAQAKELEEFFILSTGGGSVMCIQGVGLGGVGWSWLEFFVLSMCLYAAKNGCGNQTILVPDNCLAWSRLGLSTKNSSGRQL